MLSLTLLCFSYIVLTKFCVDDLYSLLLVLFLVRFSNRFSVHLPCHASGQMLLVKGIVRGSTLIMIHPLIKMLLFVIISS
jgi:hypothetical protein